MAFQPKNTVIISFGSSSEIWVFDGFSLAGAVDFRSVLVALIGPWQVNGQISGGGFWVIFQFSTFEWLLVPEVSVSRGLLLVVSLTVYPSVIGENTILDS
jgi:hypothetical protein